MHNERIVVHNGFSAPPPLRHSFPFVTSALVGYGGVSEWLKETDCKSVRLAYAGSNPASSTIPVALGLPSSRRPCFIRFCRIQIVLMIRLFGVLYVRFGLTNQIGTTNLARHSRV